MRINCAKYKFGKNRYYFEGQVCVWRGRDPAIVRIIGDSIDDKCFQVENSEVYNSLHYTNLRPATDSEIRKLGSKNILRLK